MSSPQLRLINQHCTIYIQYKIVIIWLLHFISNYSRNMCPINPPYNGKDPMSKQFMIQAVFYKPDFFFISLILNSTNIIVKVFFNPTENTESACMHYHYHDWHLWQHFEYKHVSIIIADTVSSYSIKHVCGHLIGLGTSLTRNSASLPS